MIHLTDEHRELIYTPETGRLKIAFLRGGGISKVLSIDERKRLSKALWKSCP